MDIILMPSMKLSKNFKKKKAFKKIKEEMKSITERREGKKQRKEEVWCV